MVGEFVCRIGVAKEAAFHCHYYYPEENCNQHDDIVKELYMKEEGQQEPSHVVDG